MKSTVLSFFTGLLICFFYKADAQVFNLVKDINSLTGTNPSNPSNIIEMNGIVFFTAATATTGTELWKSDGTAGGTMLVKDIWAGINGSNPQYLTNVNGVLYFRTTVAGNGYELWKSDGTAVGTVLVKGFYAINSAPVYLTDLNGVLYFSGTDAANGYELWKSDGTPGGTVLVKDIYAGTNSSAPQYLTNVNGVLYFIAYDGTNGYELWKSDGTAGGTVLVKDIYAGTFGSTPRFLTNVNGVLYFIANDGTNGDELWKSDGTAVGTVLVKDIYVGSNSSYPNYLTNVNGVLYFSADDATNGVELWKSDGTAVGTVLVKDISPGSASSNPASLTSINNKLIFTANDGINGEEVWRSEGTAGTTYIRADVAIPGGSNPTAYTEAGLLIFTVLTTDDYGRELWVEYTNIILPLSLLEFKGQLKNNDALLNWKTTNEQNPAAFELERSTNGTSYTTVATLAAKNQPGTQQYNYLDHNVSALNATVLYYRLKQKDATGKYVYSNIVALPLDSRKSMVMLYPNPVTEKLNLTISVNKAQKLQARIIDNTGKLVQRYMMNVTAGSSTTALDLSILAKGVYYFEISGEAMTERKAFVKQ